jgi:glycosyltransferase involved in cell wall biosynthesis
VRRVLLAFEPPDGGVAENVAQLAVGLRAHGWEPVLAGPADSIAYERAEAAGVAVHRIDWARGYGTPGRDVRASRQLAGLVRGGDLAVVHCHSAKAGVLGRLVGAAARVPVVYSPHCLPFVGEFGAPRRMVATAIERALGPLATRLICVCEDERRQAVGAGLDADRLRVVLNGSAPCPAGFDPDPATAALAAGGPVAAAVAVMREQKRLDVLIDAAPSILARVPDARVAIIGDGPLRDELHARAAALGLDAEPRFAFLPFQGPSWRHLAALDVFVLPSSWEGLPIGLLEAMACGVPQVATDVGGSGEAVAPETGIMVAPVDPPALADAVVELLSDPARRERMAVAGRARHAEHFGLERMVAATAAVYAEAAVSRRRAGRRPGRRSA